MRLDHRKLLARERAGTRLFMAAARHWARKYVRKPSQLDAVVQDAMIEMIEKLEAGYEPEPERILYWVFGCTNNAVRRERTRQRNNASVPYDSAIHGVGHTNPSENLRLREDLRRVDAELRACNDRVRQIFIMKLSGYSYEEIAEQLGGKPGASRMALSRLRRGLVEGLNAQEQLGVMIAQARRAAEVRQLPTRTDSSSTRA